MGNGLIRQKIFQELRKDILSCTLLPGEEVREIELANRFGVSKSPIRDALQRLEFEGLIEIVPRQGHRIAPISVADAEDMLNLREILEAGAIRNITSQADDATLAQLDDFRDQDTTNVPDFAEYNRLFHMHLCAISGNKRLADTMRSLMENYDRLCVVSLTSARTESGGMDDALVDHNAIIDALQDRNTSAAVRASGRHIRKSHGQVMRGLRKRQVVA